MATFDYSLHAEPEHMDIDGIFDNAQDIRAVRKLARKSVWGWCVVEVRCTHLETGLSASEYLGCCSYESMSDFMAGGYLDDMQREAHKCLIDKCQTVISNNDMAKAIQKQLATPL